MPCPGKFRESLECFNIDEKVINQINDGYETIDNKTPKKMRARFFKRAVDIMTEQVENERIQEIFEWNACCKGGAREKASKSFAKNNANLSLDEKLELIKDVPNMGKPVRNEDGTITVHAVYYSDGEKFLCACSNYNGVKRDYSVSRNYCYCCAGHFKYHYEIMLGVKLKQGRLKQTDGMDLHQSRSKPGAAIGLWDWNQPARILPMVCSIWERICQRLFPVQN